MKTKALFAGIAAAAMLLSGCGTSEPTPTENATLVIGTQERGDSLDPAIKWAGWPANRDGIIETLVGVDEQMKLVPRLATSWENTDENTWVFTLRDDVTFHNGTKMDAAAAQASLEYSIANNVRTEAQMPVASMSAEGNRLTIVTSTPVAALPSILSDPMTGIQVFGDGIDPATAPQGTGPFKVTEFVPHQKVELDANTDYWGGKPKLSHVTIRIYADVQSMGLAMQSDEVQVAVQPEAASLSVFSDTSKYTTWEVTSTRAEAAILNVSSPVMSDLKVRQAIAYALDREAYVSLMHGMGAPSYTLFPETVPFGGPEGLNLSVDKKDLDKAKALLIEAGYTEVDGKLVRDGEPLTIRVLTYPYRPQLGQMAALLQSDLAGIGVTVEITELSSTSDQMKAGEFDLGMYSMAMAPTSDSQYFFQTMLYSTADTNFSHYSSAEFDAAVDELATIFDPEQRIAQTHAVEQVIQDDLPYIVFGHPKWWVISSTDVHDLALRSTEYHLLSHESHVG